MVHCLVIIDHLDFYECAGVLSVERRNCSSPNGQMTIVSVLDVKF